MKGLLKVASAVGLVLTVVPSFLVLSGYMNWETHSLLMIVGMILWFGTAPFWMKKAA